MTTVANQPVGADSLSSKTMSSGQKSNVGNRESFLGKGQTGNMVGGVHAGTLGGSLGPGHGLPGATAGTLTSIEKAKKGA